MGGIWLGNATEYKDDSLRGGKRWRIGIFEKGKDGESVLRAEMAEKYGKTNIHEEFTDDWENIRERKYADGIKARFR
jgi:hypothetical protein